MPQVDFTLEVQGSGKSDSKHAAAFRFCPTRGTGHGVPLLDGDEPVTWQAFWADGSPWLARDGVARMSFTLRAPGPA